MIKECRCPNCDSDKAYYNAEADTPMFFDDDTIYVDYDCHCECGTHFTYTEWFKLCDTEIVEI